MAWDQRTTARPFALRPVGLSSPEYQNLLAFSDVPRWAPLMVSQNTLPFRVQAVAQSTYSYPDLFTEYLQWQTISAIRPFTPVRGARGHEAVNPQYPIVGDTASGLAWHGPPTLIPRQPVRIVTQPPADAPLAWLIDVPVYLCGSVGATPRPKQTAFPPASSFTMPIYPLDPAAAVYLAYAQQPVVVMPPAKPTRPAEVVWTPWVDPMTAATLQPFVSNAPLPFPQPRGAGGMQHMAFTQIPDVIVPYFGTYDGITHSLTQGLARSDIADVAAWIVGAIAPPVGGGYYVVVAQLFVPGAVVGQIADGGGYRIVAGQLFTAGAAAGQLVEAGGDFPTPNPAITYSIMIYCGPTDYAIYCGPLDYVEYR